MEAIAGRGVWLGLTLLESFMVFLPLRISQSRLGDEPRQDLDRDRLVFLGQVFPSVGLVEEKIEEVSVCFSQRCSPSWPGNWRPRGLRERGGRGERLSRRGREASLRENPGSPQEVSRGVVQARTDRSTRQRSEIYCRPARRGRAAIDLCDARPPER